MLLAFLYETEIFNKFLLSCLSNFFQTTWYSWQNHVPNQHVTCEIQDRQTTPSPRDNADGGGSWVDQKSWLGQNNQIRCEELEMGHALPEWFAQSDPVAGNKD